MYVVDEKILKRFDQRQTVFGRMKHDHLADFYLTGMYDNVEKILSENKKGYSRIDFADTMGSWAAYDYFHNAFSWDALTDANSSMKKPVLEKYVVKDKTKMTAQVKKVAKNMVLLLSELQR